MNCANIRILYPVNVLNLELTLYLSVPVNTFMLLLWKKHVEAWLQTLMTLYYYSILEQIYEGEIFVNTTAYKL